MADEKGIILLSTLIIVGVIIASTLVVITQEIIAMPIVIIAIMLALLIFYQNKDKISHLSEKLETIMFILTLLFIIISFILLYKPA